MLAVSPTYSLDIPKAFQSNIRNLVKELRLNNNYCKTANQLAKTHNSLQLRSSKKINKFIMLSGNMSLTARAKAVKNIIKKGHGVEKSLEMPIARRKTISNNLKRSSFYSGTIPTSNKHDQQQVVDYLSADVGLRGLQWGNYVTDKEREIFLSALYDAFDSLSKCLSLPPAVLSGYAQLGMAIGARGKRKDLAHFEPQSMIINLTKNGGSGSLAHEWGHFIDYVLGCYLSKNSKSFMSDLCVSTPKLKEIEISLRNIMLDFEEFFFRFSSRLKNQISFSSVQKINYWTSKNEMLARAFEVYLKNKLKENNLECSFLVGLEKSELWPNEKESIMVKPFFDSLFDWIRKNSSKLSQSNPNDETRNV